MKRFFGICGMVLLLLGCTGQAFAQGGRFTPFQEAWLRQQFANVSGASSSTVINASSWTNWYHLNSNAWTTVLGRTSLWDMASIDAIWATNWISTNTLQAQLGAANSRISVLEGTALNGAVLPFVAEGQWVYSPNLVIQKEKLDIPWSMSDNGLIVPGTELPGLWDWDTTNHWLVPRSDWRRDTVWTTNANGWLVLR